MRDTYRFFSPSLAKGLAGFIICLFSLFATIIKADDTLLPLGGAKAIDVTGNFIESAAQFSGSVSSGTAATMITTSVGQLISVKMSISADPSDVGKTVDILFVIGSEPPPAPYSGNEDTFYMAATKNNEFVFVDLYDAPQVWMAQLSEPFSSGVVLENQTSVELGHLAFRPNEGMSYFFIGYRLDNGTIVYTAKPLMAEVQETQAVPSPTTVDQPAAPTGGEPAEFAGIVAAHNTWRQKVNVADLTWSDAAAKVAQAWADELKGRGCAMEHNPNRGEYGENIFWSMGYNPTTKQVVEAWGNEVSDYNYATNSCAPGKMCGHYTQVVWSDTQQVGCGKATCGNQQIWVCNYSPPGNYIGQKPY